MNRADELVERVKDIPTLPSVVVHVNRVLQDDKESLDSVVPIIERDPPLTSKVLRLANSSYYGMSRHVRTVKEAILILGLNTIRSIAMTVSVGKLFHKDLGDVLNMKELWIHSLYCAVASKGLMQGLGTVVAEEGFVCGLVHDIGKVIMAMNLPEETRTIGKAFVAEEGRSWWEVEREVVGFTHAEVGGLIARRWNFPRPYCEAIETHHWPEEGNGGTPENRLAYAISTADSIVRAEGRGGAEAKHLPGPTVLQALKIDEGTYPNLLERTREDFENVMDTWDLV